MAAYDLSTVIGDLTPITALQQQLQRAGVQVEIHIGAVSPITGEGARVCAGDAIGGRKEWHVYCPPHIKAHQIYHELLHVRWYDVDHAQWLHGTPITDKGIRSGLMLLNNDLDHAHIVREEIAAYPEAAAYWARDFALLFAKRPQGDTPGDRQHRRLTLLRGWMTLPIALPEAGITHQFADALQAEGWMAQARRMSARVQAAGTDKAAGIAALREAMEADVPAAQFCAFSLRLPTAPVALPANVPGGTIASAITESPSP
jgi:hypothetical protein